MNDTNTTWFDRYDYNEYSTSETEHAFGGNVEFDLKINNQISGKVKFGFKNRDKTREHDRDYEYGAFTYVAHVGKRNETYEMFDWLNSPSRIQSMLNTILLWIEIMMMKGFWMVSITWTICRS